MCITVPIAAESAATLVPTIADPAVTGPTPTVPAVTDPAVFSPLVSLSSRNVEASTAVTTVVPNTSPDITMTSATPLNSQDNNQTMALIPSNVKLLPPPTHIPTSTVHLSPPTLTEEAIPKAKCHSPTLGGAMIKKEYWKLWCSLISRSLPCCQSCHQTSLQGWRGE